jgi:hypothetical protein
MDRSMGLMTEVLSLMTGLTSLMGRSIERRSRVMSEMDRLMKLHGSIPWV